MKTEILIIGGGVIGGAIARELSRYNLDITLVEKNADIATGTSKANSGIIHAGYNAELNTLKGQLNIAANQRFDKLCQDLKVPFKRIGSLVVGFNENDLKKLKEKKENGKNLGVKGLEIIGQDKLFALEKNLNKKIKYALYAPSAGIISPFELAIAYLDNAVINGVKVLLNTQVQGIIVKDNNIKIVKTNQQEMQAKIVINAAGLFADKIANIGGDNIKITPRKGEYHLFDKEYSCLVNHVIFPMPRKESKGILVTPTIHGNLIIGPNANFLNDKTDTSTSKEGLAEVVEGAKEIIPSLPRDGVIASFAGLRAVAEGEDFIIGFSKKTKGLLNVAGIQSPGLSAAPAIAEKVIELFKDYLKKEEKIKLVEKEEFKECLDKKPKFVDYQDSLDEWQTIIETNRDYGKIVCRCESVTKGEIIEAIHSPVPARTLDGIKRRTRAGMGRCQGGFCSPRIVDILAKELKVSPLKITKTGGQSYILKAKAKELINQNKSSKVGVDYES